jgi:hypothetical protein
VPTITSDFFAQLNETSLPLRFAVDLISLLIMTVGLYYRRYRRRDVLVVLIAFNVGLFSVLTVSNFPQALALGSLRFFPSFVYGVSQSAMLS